MFNLTEVLEAIALWFRSLGIPESIVRWGHPAMMAIVIFAMGSFVGFAGWRGRVATDKAITSKSLADHRTLAPWMFLFMALGYTGGVLSLVMQRQPIMESPHFWTGSSLLVLLLVNAAIALFGFGRDQGTLRTIHAYLGSTALGLMVLHAVFGLKLGLAI
ncbi:DUF4079 domain-containing protein [Gloeocapsopsis crepidinum LEGE 06123]|uniref:DUF4079 domain-containing protein n=1 Tax=Gloeocapsopsis crepidinum LEGE 06123 TaxID=588587 RepID=A0ABR9UWJ4_9CHRO|nr:DUF4079 domain-containing protein [Gloeocapsopsis crepidinum]MBE9192667.1 DUF4079 domain-containing protein [Gloeocapsopsis crepidinum LEGE 06123]